ncbi:MAG: ABC-three component system protein [Gemmatimonadaceae bacterium]
MIHSVTANQQSFHAVEFTTGLNVILAERSQTSTVKDTRNGLGKSTLIEIIDFCLGSRANQGTGLLIEPLKDWAFTVELTLAGNRVRATRAVADQNRVVIDGSTTGWLEQPDTDEASDDRVFRAERWRTLLGWALFDVPRSADQFPYKPSYRSLVSYFIRRGPDAYTSPFRHFRQQKTWDIQLHTAYLLGMNWEYAARWQSLRDQQDGMRAIEKAIKTGAMKGAVGSVGELETQRIQLEQEANAARRALDTFKVHPQYESIQQDADRLTSEVHGLVNSNVSDRRRLTCYRESIKDEKSPKASSLERLYEESGLVFPDAVRRSLDQARTFHEQVVSNRRAFLQTEINRLEQVINEREIKIKGLTDQRAEVLQVLETHSALQEMTHLQQRFVELQGSLERVQARLREMKNLKTTMREVKTAKEELVRTAEQDHEERKDAWSAAVRLFNEHSQALYESPGRLIIDVGDTGYKYQVDIERSGSEGIEKMKVFCFDLAILQLQMQNRHGIDFLVHDTLIYDSVDARQRALAFERAHEVTSALGGQYICTMNSDMVPRDDFSRGFAFEPCIRLTLSDATPSGSLLGMRFERPGR